MVKVLSARSINQYSPMPSSAYNPLFAQRSRVTDDGDTISTATRTVAWGVVRRAHSVPDDEYVRNEKAFAMAAGRHAQLPVDDLIAVLVLGKAREVSQRPVIPTEIHGLAHTQSVRPDPPTPYGPGPAGMLRLRVRQVLQAQ